MLVNNAPYGYHVQSVPPFTLRYTETSYGFINHMALSAAKVITQSA